MTKAPIGYRNVGVCDEFGCEVRTVEIDQERAPLVRWAFQVFASGDWTTGQLHRELVARGLTTPATPRRPSRPIGKSSVYRMLTNPYYKGVSATGVSPMRVPMRCSWRTRCEIESRPCWVRTARPRMRPRCTSTI